MSTFCLEPVIDRGFRFEELPGAWNISYLRHFGEVVVFSGAEQWNRYRIELYRHQARDLCGARDLIVPTWAPKSRSPYFERSLPNPIQGAQARPG